MLVLYNIILWQDPINLGAIIHSAYFLGVDKIITLAHMW